MKYKFTFLFFVSFFLASSAQTAVWIPYLVLTYKYTQPDGFLKTQIIVKKDSLIYQSFEPGKERLRRMALDTAKQRAIKNLIDEHKLLKLNTRAAIKNPQANSYTYVMDKFRKVIYEPPYNSKRQSKFDAFNKAFLEIALPFVLREELKGSWR